MGNTKVIAAVYGPREVPFNYTYGWTFYFLFLKKQLKLIHDIWKQFRYSLAKHFGKKKACFLVVVKAVTAVECKQNIWAKQKIIF